jgi:hypothetical protein
MFSIELVLPRRSSVAIAGSGRLRRLKTGGQPRTSPGAAKFRRASTLNGSADFAEIAMMILRTMALMSSALAGTPKYTAADIAGGRV